MTTNVVDRKKRILASDSRWSHEDKVNNRLIFVDDTGFDKLTNRLGAAMVCAGFGPLIDEWKDWFLALNFDFDNMPKTEIVVDGELRDIAISVCAKPNCDPLYIHGKVTVHRDIALFSGSGTLPAFACFMMNECCKRAVGTAGKSDPATGGTTLFCEFDSGHHNLATGRVRHAHAVAELNKRGMIMDLTTKEVVPINPADTNITQAGGFSLSAPTGLPARKWLDSERLALKKAFEQVAEIEAEMLRNKQG